MVIWITNYNSSLEKKNIIQFLQIRSVNDKEWPQNSTTSWVSVKQDWNMDAIVYLEQENSAAKLQRTRWNQQLTSGWVLKLTEFSLGSHWISIFGIITITHQNKQSLCCTLLFSSTMDHALATVAYHSASLSCTWHGARNLSFLPLSKYT